jgi:2-polyprenyl-3-methyl-5-hydroxy-6-metoxy-1,4-benzoquinol methylase
MSLQLYTNRLIVDQAKKVRLELSDLNRALTRAIDQVSGSEYVFNQREVLNAVNCYHKDGRLLDLGGGGSIYHLILKNLGMDVTILDFNFNPALARPLENAGVRMTKGDLYASPFGTGEYDVISTFECFEHLPHSPKRVMDKICPALKHGGKFVLSIPNVVRFDQRLRVLTGQTPHEKYGPFYHSGDYFAGHHREMTVKEVKYLFGENHLVIEDLFTTDMTVQSAKKRNPLKRAMNRLNYRFLLTDAIMPQTLRKHIWARGRKAS